MYKGPPKLRVINNPNKIYKLDNIELSRKVSFWKTAFIFSLGINIALVIILIIKGQNV